MSGRQLLFSGKKCSSIKAAAEMNKEDPVPPVRDDLEVIPTSHQGRKALLVRDFLGLVRDPVILQGDTLQIVGLIDGKRSIRDIQLELIRFKNGLLVDADAIRRLIRELDSAFLLQSSRYRSEKQKTLAEYLNLEVRPPSHAGVSYPAQPEELKAFLDSILGGAVGNGTAGTCDGVCGLVAPHIDPEIGKVVYGSAYRSIRSARPRRVLLLGTGHSLDDAYFALTEKDYLTPLGRVKTDRRAVRKLKKAGGTAVSRYDISHRREHSLEFQLVFLQHLFGSSFTAVPILCGSFGRDLDRVSRPSEIPDVAAFLGVLRALWTEDPAGTLFIAAVDFSHIGPKFGHRERATSVLLEAKKHDRALIAALAASDSRAFWAESRRTGDRYNVCGFSTLASLLDTVPGLKGRLVDYQFWKEEATQSAVSFAAIVLVAER
jgi:AmmeMemoRadiSam system protein B